MTSIYCPTSHPTFPRRWALVITVCRKRNRCEDSFTSPVNGLGSDGMGTAVHTVCNSQNRADHLLPAFQTAVKPGLPRLLFLTRPPVAACLSARRQSKLSNNKESYLQERAMHIRMSCSAWPAKTEPFFRRMVRLFQSRFCSAARLMAIHGHFRNAGSGDGERRPACSEATTHIPP
jgi:hypothetical protein